MHRRLASGPVAVLLVVSAALPSALAAQLVGTVGFDPDVQAGTDGRGRVLLYAPDPVEPGSSISHFDRTAAPNLLMEPSINSDLRPLDVDITAGAMRDVGWITNGGAQFVANFLDNPGQGFFDAALGAQRRTAFQRAMDVWSAVLTSSVPIVVDVRFQSLTCSMTGGATLAQAATNFIFEVAGSAFPGTWYHGALAEALTGQDLSAQGNPNSGDIRVTFNSQIDQQCLGNGVRFSYDLSGTAPPGEISFVQTAMHELGHGLGFANFVDETTGQFFQGKPDIYTQFTRDNVLRRTWANLGPAAIRDSAVRTGQVAWDGNEANRQAARLLLQQPVVRIESPLSVAQQFVAGTATFGPSVQEQPATAEFAVARPQLACTGINNQGAIRDKIAIVVRGDCLFVEKVRHAQAAGAVAVVVVNNEPGILSMGGDASDLEIPALLISDVDGATLIDLTENPPDDGGDDDDDDDGGGGDDDDDDDDDEEPSVCVASETALCLQGGRFRVEVTFVSGAGEQPMMATAELLTDDTGYFTFFDAANVEVVVKVLDGCSITSHFWVFSGGLTDREVRLKVVDTTTGRVRTYRNTLADPFQPIQDTAAFDTCSI